MAVTNIVYPYVFEGGEKAVASEVNADFDQVKIFANSVIAEINAINQAIADLEEKPTREMFDVYFSIKGETPTGAYPLWTGETITNCKILYPDFWNELTRLAGNNAVPTVESSAAFDDMVEEYGECPCFYIDTLNGHVRLPKITRFISSISQLSELGAAYNDRVSKHSHTSRVGSSAITASNKNALRFDVAQFSAGGTTAASGDGEGWPKHVRLALYIQVVNNTAEISRFDVDALKTELEEALADLKAAYDGYAAAMQAEYEKIKDSIADAAKIYKYENVVVPVSAFVADDTYADYPFKADVDVPDATVDLVPTVVFSLDDAQSGNFAPIAESGDEYVRIWTKEKPEDDVTIPTILVQ